MTPERSLLRALVRRLLARGLIGLLVWAWALSSPVAAQDVSDEVRSLFGPLAIQVPSQAASAPLFSLPDLNGAQVRLADLKSRALMLYFWTTW